MTENVIGRGKLSDTFEVSDSYATTFWVITETVCSLFIECSDTSPTYCIVCGCISSTQCLISSFRQNARHVTPLREMIGSSFFADHAGQQFARSLHQDADNAAGRLQGILFRPSFSAETAGHLRHILIERFQRRFTMA